MANDSRQGKFPAFFFFPDFSSEYFQILLQLGFQVLQSRLARMLVAASLDSPAYRNLFPLTLSPACFFLFLSLNNRGFIKFGRDKVYFPRFRIGKLENEF